MCQVGRTGKLIFVMFLEKWKREIQFWEVRRFSRKVKVKVKVKGKVKEKVKVSRKVKERDPILRGRESF